jgi:hypothetical protein
MFVIYIEMHGENSVKNSPEFVRSFGTRCQKYSPALSKAEGVKEYRF